MEYFMGGWNKSSAVRLLMCTILIMRPSYLIWRVYSASGLAPGAGAAAGACPAGACAAGAAGGAGGFWLMSARGKARAMTTAKAVFFIKTLSYKNFGLAQL